MPDSPVTKEMRTLLDDLNLHRPGLGFAGSNDQYCRNWSRQRRTSLGVPDRGRDTLRLPRSGGPVQVVGTGFGLISGLTFNSLGQLYVADRVDNVIWQFDPVPEIKAMVDVTYDSPVIDFGPLSFGLTELPAEPEVTFLLGDGTPAGGGATSYGLADVVSTNLVFGDVIGPNNLTAFATEVDPGGVTTALSYAFAIPDTPTAEGIIILNFPYTVTGTDIVSGDDFSYTYANSEVTITPVPGPGDFNGDLIVDGADFLKWQREDGTPASLLEWEANYGNDYALAAVTATVPEPSSFALIAVGLFGISYRRQKQA